MILVFGGTTEGRIAVSLLEEAAKPYYYSTKGTLQQVEIRNGIRISGEMDEETMVVFCKENTIELIIDAAHPFAEGLHKTVSQASAVLNIPVVRLERKYPEREDAFIWCETYEDAIQKMRSCKIQRLLALTGVNTISKLKPFWAEISCWFRILDREESKEIARNEGFPASNLLYFKEKNDEIALIKTMAPDAVIMKESGESGYFLEKTAAAKRLGIPVFVIKRPRLSNRFYIVYGKEGLRKQVERFSPGFFPLKSGYTTGSCATAAVKGALVTLIHHVFPEEIDIALPSQEMVTLPVSHSALIRENAICTVIKQSGDDPDVTNGLSISATMCFGISSNNVLPNVMLQTGKGYPIMLCGGSGIGRVTLPGLGLKIGGPAINKTPCEMIMNEVDECMSEYQGVHRRLTIILSVDRGCEVAHRTFNPKLGIVDGISIIGTSGIVKPFSHEAFIGSIRKELEVAKALSCKPVIINSGAKSEKYLKAKHPELLPQAFIHYGNYIGETLRIASDLALPELIMGIMIGKAVKLAHGALDTHSHKTVMDLSFLTQLASECGVMKEEIDKIASITLARELWAILPVEKYSGFYDGLIARCIAVCRPHYPNGILKIYLIEESGKLYC